MNDYATFECYKCNGKFSVLSARGRCITCEYESNQFNEKENEELRKNFIALESAQKFHHDNLMIVEKDRQKSKDALVVAVKCLQDISEGDTPSYEVDDISEHPGILYQRYAKETLAKLTTINLTQSK